MLKSAASSLFYSETDHPTMPTKAITTLRSILIAAAPLVDCVGFPDADVFDGFPVATRRPT